MFKTFLLGLFVNVNGTKIEEKKGTTGLVVTAPPPLAQDRPRASGLGPRLGAQDPIRKRPRLKRAMTRHRLERGIGTPRGPVVKSYLILCRHRGIC